MYGSCTNTQNTDNEVEILVPSLSNATINKDEENDEQECSEVDIEEHQEQFPMKVASRNTSNTWSLMNVIKGNLGTGILAMPIAVKNMGLLLGTASILVIGAMSTHCMHLLLSNSRTIRERYGIEYMEYADLMYRASKIRFFNPKIPIYIKNIVNASLLITQIGFCCVYILFIAENTHEIIKCYSSYNNINMYLLKFLVLLALLPFTFVKKLKVLSYFSTLANIATMFGLTFTFVYCLHNIKFRISDFSLVEPIDNWPISFGIIIFAFEGIALVLPIEASMTHPQNLSGLSGVLQLGMTIVISLYTALGFFGYAKFHQDTKSSITLNIPCDNNIWHAAIKPLFCLCMYVTYGLAFYVPAEILTSAMRTRVTNVRRHVIYDTIIRVVMALFTYVAAATIPHLDLMIALIGAFSSSCLALIFPVLIDSFVMHGDSRYHSVKMTKNILIGGIGVTGFIIGTGTTAYQIVKAFQKEMNNNSTLT